MVDGQHLGYEHIEGGTGQLAAVQRDDDGSALIDGELLPFRNFTFFLGREVSRSSVAFVIQAMGGKCGWQELVDESGSGKKSSLINEDDPSITHQIVDRPSLANMRADRQYIPPQWVFDCLNASSFLDSAQYRIGQSLPSHLSPFVTEKEDEEEAADTMDVEETPEAQEKASEAKEKKALAESMLSKKHRKLYKQMQHSRQRKATEKKTLVDKKKAIQAKKTAAK